MRTIAWYNGLRAAYPNESFRWRNIWAAEVAGNGISSVIPAHAGAFVRLYLGKQTVQEFQLRDGRFVLHGRGAVRRR